MTTYDLNSITHGNNTYNLRDTTKIPLSGTNALSGSIIPDTDNSYNFGDSSKNLQKVYTTAVYHGLNTGSLVLSGGNGASNGAYLALYGASRTDGFQGRFDLVAKGSSNYSLTGKTDGTLTWGSKNVAMQEDVIPKSGGAVLSGTEYYRTVNNSFLFISGGTSGLNGGSIEFYGKDHTYAGFVALRATDSSNYSQVILQPSGAFMLINNGIGKSIAMQEDTVPRSGGEVLAGQQYKRTVDNDSLYFYGGKGWEHGGMVAMFGKDHSTAAGKVQLIPSIQGRTKSMDLASDGTWTWSGSACQITSDQRLKQQIAEIDDKLLDAWEDVTLVQFKYNDAVDAKKDKARLHTGYVVQQIDEACKKHNVDISEYGLYCHEEYPEETEEVENEDGTKETKVIRPASEHYSLRYTEALIVECAYLRKCIKELKEEIKELKNKD